MADTKNPHGLTVGQQMWFVPGARYQGDPRFIVIEKVGNKWATLGNDWLSIRIDIRTLRQDSASTNSPGQAYLSRDAYESERRLSMTWGVLKSKLMNNYGNPPAGVTEHDIRAAAKLLCIELPDIKPVKDEGEQQ